MQMGMQQEAFLCTNSLGSAIGRDFRSEFGVALICSVGQLHRLVLEFTSADAHDGASDALWFAVPRRFLLTIA